jgi:mannose-1-phosphate guanylyltransferase
MKNFSPELFKRYNEFRKISNQNFDKYYLSLAPDTIDYALIEKVDDLLVVPANFDWLDLGSYTDIHKVVDTDDDDVYIKGKNVGVEAVENAYIHNDENKPVVVIGLDNVVVVNTADGLLVARKDQSQKVKDVLSNLKSSSNK